MTVKLSVTVADRADWTLRALANEHGANHSVVMEAALMHFADFPAAERNLLIRGIHANKKAYTRPRWRAAFFDSMFDEFWFAKKLRGGRRTEFTPVTFAGYQVWFLLENLIGPESEDEPLFCVQIMASPAEMRLNTADAQHQFTFSRDLSPYDAARQVADFIRERVSPLGTLEVLDLPEGVMALLDHAGGHWMARPEVHQLRLPIKVRGRDREYILDRDFILRRGSA